MACYEHGHTLRCRWDWSRRLERSEGSGLWNFSFFVPGSLPSQSLPENSHTGRRRRTFFALNGTVILVALNWKVQLNPLTFPRFVAEDEGRGRGVAFFFLSDVLFPLSSFVSFIHIPFLRSFSHSFFHSFTTYTHLPSLSLYHLLHTLALCRRHKSN